MPPPALPLFREAGGGEVAANGAPRIRFHLLPEACVRGVHGGSWVAVLSIRVALYSEQIRRPGALRS